MTDAERRDALEQIATEVRVCDRCRLHETRQRAVPGEGNPATEVLFVGEAPGQNEDREGRPFVGAAGSFLTELLGSVDWRRDEVFITNVVKCRPPGNRDPEPDEIAACAPYLARQMAALDPALVVTLGRHSLGRFMPGARIGQAHGTTRPIETEMGPSDALVFAMYHPAAALHQGSLRQTLLDDMQTVPAALLAARDRRERLALEREAAAGFAEDGGLESAAAFDGAEVLEANVADVVGAEAEPAEVETASLMAPLTPPAAPAELAVTTEPGAAAVEPLAIAPEIEEVEPIPVVDAPPRPFAPLTAAPSVATLPSLEADPSADQLTLF